MVRSSVCMKTLPLLTDAGADLFCGYERSGLTAHHGWEEGVE